MAFSFALLHSRFPQDEIVVQNKPSCISYYDKSAVRNAVNESPALWYLPCDVSEMFRYYMSTGVANDIGAGVQLSVRLVHSN